MGKRFAQEVESHQLNVASGLAVVIPQLVDGRFVLNVCRNCGTGKLSLRFPRGFAEDGDGGLWKKTAIRQLRERAGLASHRLQLLGAVDVASPMMPTRAIVALAKNCDLLPPPSDEQDAPPRAIAIDLAGLNSFIRSGVVDCGLTLAALALYRA